jgi:hypothetical protein
MRGDIGFALVQWAISYKRATLMQVPLALMGCVASVAAWLLGANALWLVAGLLIGAAVPFTLIVSMPYGRYELESLVPALSKLAKIV